MILYYWQAKGP